jgi:hypothetical protein
MTVRLDVERILWIVIIIGGAVLLAEVGAYYLLPEIGQESMISPPPVGEFIYLGVDVPEEVLRRGTRILAVMPLPCHGCDENVPTWNSLMEMGVSVTGVSQGIEVDAALFRRRTAADFPVMVWNEDSFWYRFGDPDHFPVTLVVNEQRAVVWAKIGRVWNAARIAAQVRPESDAAFRSR